MRHGKTLVIVATLWGALSLAAFGQATLTLAFEEMTPHVGQAFELRVVDEASGREIVRVWVPEIVGAAFELEIDEVKLGGSYRIDFYADANRNGRYDVPPGDHAWRIEIPEIQHKTSLAFRHTADFTDIAWPPHLDGVIEEMEYRNEMIDTGTGMSVFWQNDGSNLYVGLVAPGTGWLSIGFGPKNRMQGANILIAAIAAELTIEDHYGNTPTSHRRDDVDHIIQAAGRETDGISTLEFAIPLDSADDQDVPLAPGSEVVIILAYHASNDGLTARHTARSTTSIALDK